MSFQLVVAYIELAGDVRDAVLVEVIKDLDDRLRLLPRVDDDDLRI